MTEINSLVDAFAQCSESDVKRLVSELLAAGVSATDIVAQCNKGMINLGERFGRGECFLPDLMFGGMIMKGIMSDLGTTLEETGVDQSRGTVVVGSVRHDVHDIGKDIICMMLRGTGFRVIDLGVDVPAEQFVEAVREHQPVAVGMSILLTTCYPSVSEVVTALQEAGLRETVSVLVGGAAASELLKEDAGCDFYGKTAVDGVNFIAQLVA